jgi:integrase
MGFVVSSGEEIGVSIEKVQRQGRAVWRVRWRDELNRERSKVLGTKRDAEAFDAEIRRRKRTGELATMDAGKETLANFAEEWWRLYAVPNLAPKTLRVYADLWDRYVLPRLGGYPLRNLTPEVLARFRADLAGAGVGDPTIRKLMSIVQGVLQRAVEWHRLTTNPARAVRKPPQKRMRRIEPPSPLAVERMRARLRANGRLRDATLVCVLAYAGLRPGEALALEWQHIGDRTILIEGAVALGNVKETKTRQTRSVRLLPPLATDVAEWRLACGRPDGSTFVFPGLEGRPWADHDWRNWRKRVYAPVAEAVQLDGSRPYDLRHAFCSLLIAEGLSVVEIAQQAGHSPAMMLATYAHVIEELAGTERRPAEAVIRDARDKLVSEMCPPATRQRRH